MVMHGESCDVENVASNMYCENNHETATISVTVDVTWTENGQARHQNQTVSVPPNGKKLLGCEWNGSVYRRYEIMTSSY